MKDVIATIAEPNNACPDSIFLEWERDLEQALEKKRDEILGTDAWASRPQENF